MKAAVPSCRAIAAACLVLLTGAVGRLEAQHLAVGGGLGVVVGTARFEDDESNNRQQPMTGLQVGAAVAYDLGQVLSVQTGLWFVQKGWIEYNDGGGRRLSYLELPLLLTVAAPWTTAPEVVVGTFVGVELGCSVVDIPHTGSVSCDDPRVEWQRAPLQYGTRFGLGMRRRVGAGRLHVQLSGDLNRLNLNREPLPRGYTRLFSVAVSAVYTVPLSGGRR